MRLKSEDVSQILAKPGYCVAGQSVATPVRHPIPEPDVREESLVVNEDEKAGAGRITVSIHRFGAKLLDADNLAGGCKPLLDALRYAKYIPEDNPKAIKLHVSQSVVPKAKRGVLIRITPA